MEGDQGAPLPEAYREFLLQMGRAAGSLFQGTDVLYPELLGLKAAAQEILAEGGSLKSLEDDAVVVAMNQGYQFAYIRAAEGDDPPVYFYSEGEQEPVVRWRSFSELLNADIDSAEQHNRGQIPNSESVD